MNYLRVLVAVAAVGGAFVGIGRPLHADEPATPPSAVDDRLNKLEEEIRILKQQLDAERDAAAEKGKQDQLEQDVRVLKRQREIEKEEATTKAKEAPIITAGKEGFAIKTADGNFRLRLGGYVQADERFFVDDHAAKLSDTFLVRRARLIVDATVYKDFNFLLQPDFGQGQTVLFDAYAEWKHWPWLAIRGGKFKPPISLERLQNDINQLFPEVGLATEISPVRDVGFQVGGEVFNGAVNYAVGAFNGATDYSSTIDIDSGDAKDVAARIFVKPLKNTDIGPLQGFGFGIGGSYGSQQTTSTSTNLPSYKTAGQNTFFSYRSTTFPNGERIRLVPQFNYYWGSFGLFGEYALSEQQVQNGARSDRLRNRAWDVAASYVLTGDDASSNGVDPKHPFNFKTGDWGAFEVAARFGQLKIDSDAFTTPGGATSFADPTTSASKATAWGVGLNWYLNRNVRADLDYEQTQFSGGNGAGDRAREKVLFTRLQLAF